MGKIVINFGFMLGISVLFLLLNPVDILSPNGIDQLKCKDSILVFFLYMEGQELLNSGKVFA